MNETTNNGWIHKQKRESLLYFIVYDSPDKLSKL